MEMGNPRPVIALPGLDGATGLLLDHLLGQEDHPQDGGSLVASFLTPTYTLQPLLLLPLKFIQTQLVLPL